MLAHGNALGSGIVRALSALKGRRIPPPFQGGQNRLGRNPGALPRAGFLRTVGATPRLAFTRRELPMGIYGMALDRKETRIER